MSGRVEMAAKRRHPINSQYLRYVSFEFSSGHMDLDYLALASAGVLYVRVLPSMLNRRSRLLMYMCHDKNMLLVQGSLLTYIPGQCLSVPWWVILNRSWNSLARGMILLLQCAMTRSSTMAPTISTFPFSCERMYRQGSLWGCLNFISSNFSRKHLLKRRGAWHKPHNDFRNFT